MDVNIEALIRHPERAVALDGGINFRDLGGYPSRDGRTVRWRKLMRCGHLNLLSPADVDWLGQNNVTAIHDFRRPEERDRTPSVATNAAVSEDYDLFIGSLGNFWDMLRSGTLDEQTSQQLLIDSYQECIRDVTPLYQLFIQRLIDNREGASIFHCAAGKDRTGIAAAIILMILDVPREVIVEDYLLTREHYDTEPLMQIIEGHLRRNNIESWDRDWLMPYCSVHEDNIAAFYRAMDTEYGSEGQYLQDGLGLTPSDIERMRDIYLES